MLIKLTIGNESVEHRLQIDRLTKENIQAVVKRGGLQHKWRLSFQGVFDSVDDNYRGFITKMSVGHSERISFRCSKAFVDDLRRLKEVTDLSYVRPLVGDRTTPVRQTKKRLSVRECAICVTIGMVCLSLPLFVMVKNALSTSNSGEVYASAVAPSGVSERDRVESLQRDHPEREENITHDAVEAASSGKLPSAKLTETVTYGLAANEVALTFDDGPSEYTKEIVDILADKGVGGTFFFVGKNVEKHEDAVKYVYEHGYAIGNHSFSHAAFPSQSRAKQKGELLQTNAMIEQITSAPVTLFRPPYGAKNDLTVELVEQHQMKMVLWNTDPEDWNVRHADEVLDAALNTDSSSGAIYLFHELPATVEALPEIIDTLKAQGLNIVSLE